MESLYPWEQCLANRDSRWCINKCPSLSTFKWVNSEVYSAPFLSGPYRIKPWLPTVETSLLLCSYWLLAAVTASRVLIPFLVFWDLLPNKLPALEYLSWVQLLEEPNPWQYDKSKYKNSLLSMNLQSSCEDRINELESEHKLDALLGVADFQNIKQVCSNHYGLE